MGPCSSAYTTATCHRWRVSAVRCRNREQLKRIWTDSRYRRRGYAKALLAELETEIAARGYHHVYLTTGDRQPEAEELYLSLGYLRLDEPLPAEGEVYPVAFQKTLLR